MPRTTDEAASKLLRVKWSVVHAVILAGVCEKRESKLLSRSFTGTIAR
jgi:hypothetical protein